MLKLSELDNEMTKKQLSKTFPNKVDIKFGLDANKIKGVNNFPIYYETDGFTSHAKPNVDSFMFHTPHNTNKCNVAKHTHTPVGEIRPYLFDKQSPSQPKETNVRMRQGEISSLYGLPADKTILLENPTAQAMGKITEEEFSVKQWRANPDGGSGGVLPTELENIVSGDSTEPQRAPPLTEHTESEKPSATTPTATATEGKVETQSAPFFHLKTK
jgi:hypothetical protein